MSAQRARLAGHRWHFSHGPIDLVIGADGEAAAVAAAHEAAWARFEGLLAELVAELPNLRAQVGDRCPVGGAVARRMWRACHPLRERFITSMAAVAGSVADEIASLYRRTGVARAWVNNGGDIALHLAPGKSVRVGLFADLARFDAAAGLAALGIDGRFEIDASAPVRGIATSGWRGRSFSLGIADSVTVLAATAAQADAAATVIANAVDAPDARIVRRAASELSDDTDLGDLPVVVDVPILDAGTVRSALCTGLVRARELRDLGLIQDAVLACQGQAVSATRTARERSIAA